MLNYWAVSWASCILGSYWIKARHNTPDGSWGCADFDLMPLHNSTVNLCQRSIGKLHSWASERGKCCQPFWKVSRTVTSQHNVNLAAQAIAAHSQEPWIACVLCKIHSFWSPPETTLAAAVFWEHRHLLVSLSPIKLINFHTAKK